MYLQYLSFFPLPASGKNDYVEVYCGNEMLKYLGLVWVGPETGPSKPKISPTVETAGATNGTKQETPHIVSDMGK